MAGNVLELRGCTPEPLGDYLKGLGVFRLIAEQVDPESRAWWESGVLRLHTKWSRDEAIAFFLHGLGDVAARKDRVYSPTPIFAPWGGRPGFYNDGNKDARRRLVRIMFESLENQRFIEAADSICKIRFSLRQCGWHKTKPKKEKAELAAVCRNRWDRNAVDWFDACLSLEEDARFGFLYGTGGNEGSADITNNFWELIEEVIGLPTPRTDARDLLLASLFADSRVGGTSKTAGQHFPLAGGSSNCGQDFFSSSSTNPWDVVLMMEGAILFAGATTKRLSQLGKGKSAFPFMIDHLSADEPSTSTKDEAKQDAKVMRCRAEFWMPLWTSPTSLPAVRALLAEGRLQRTSGARTEHSLHAMEAIRSIGVSRGIDTFHRVALFERRGKGYYLASSLGYHPTSRSAASFSSQLSQLDAFRQQVYRNLREGPGVPDRVIRARHALHSVLATLLERDEPSTIKSSDALLEILVAASNVEGEVTLLNDRSRLLTPSPALTATWMGNGVNQAEYRLARAIAGICDWGDKAVDGRSLPAVESIRANLLPVARRGKAWIWDDTSRSSVWSRGASMETNLVAVLRRRLIDAQKHTGGGLPLWSSYGAGFGDLLAFWHDAINDDRLANLIHGLALVDSGPWNQMVIDNRQRRDQPTPDLQTGAVWFDADDQAHITASRVEWRGKLLITSSDLRAAFELPRFYHLLKLCFTGGRLPRRPVERATIPRDGEEPFPPSCLDVLALLEAGRLADAVRLAARRLRAKGYPALLRDGDLQSVDMTFDDCRRLAGMLLIPVRHPGVCAALAIKPEVSH